MVTGLVRDGFVPLAHTDMRGLVPSKCSPPVRPLCLPMASPLGRHRARLKSRPAGPITVAHDRASLPDCAPFSQPLPLCAVPHEKGTSSLCPPKGRAGTSPAQLQMLHEPRT